MFRTQISAFLLTTAVLMSNSVFAGTWTQVVKQNPMYYNGTMLLLTDGSVMVESAYDNQTWTKLSPDATGSYVNGTWTTLAKMSIPRLYFASHVLPDGRVFVLGGEYSGQSLNQNITNTGEIYNPATNKWSQISPFPRSSFGDDPTVLLPDGTILAGYIFGPQTYNYYPQYDFWFQGPTKLRNDRSDEEYFMALPGYQYLSYDIFASDAQQVGQSQRYDYFSDSWIDSGTVPVLLSGQAQGFELGPCAMLPNGKAIVIGANENTAIWTPPANSQGTGSWVAGPTMPAGMGADDAPGAMLPDGHFLFLADFYEFNPPTSLFDYNYVNNSLTDITATLPTALQDELFFSSAFTCRMLVLPDGGLLLTTGFNTMWEYKPSGTPLANWKPTISSVSKVGSHSYQVVGSRLTGISEGATYGDDVECSTNYPMARIVKGSVVKYAKTTNWTPGISKPGDTSLQSFQFDVPAGTVAGTYQLTVIANGIASAPVNFTYTPPAVTASFSNGTLNITGDADADNVVVSYKQVKVSGVLKSASVTVAAGDAYTSINGTTSVTLDVGINRFKVNAIMNGGDDTITFNSLFCTNFSLSLGDGNDTASFLYNSITTALVVDGGNGSDVVTFTGNSITKQTITNVP